MGLPRLLILGVTILTSQFCEAQADSTLEALQQIPAKYITAVDQKIDKYSNRITHKTEKTLAKLSRLENKIHTLLQKVNPDAAARLFGNNQTTFANLLQKVKDGQAIAQNYKSRYDSYRDKLTTSLKYLENQKDNLKSTVIKPLNDASKKLSALEQDVNNSEAVEKFIKERKKQLLDEAIKYIGNSKYLTTINKEAYYYVETLRNYKQLFSDKKKAEETALGLLNKIPAFQKFFRENGRLASLFGISINDPGAQSVAGMQTRESVNAMIQQRMTSGGPNGAQYISENIHQAHNEFDNLKRKIANAGSGNSDANIPSFKPNTQKTKTFLQRLEFGTNFQFAKNNSLVPTTADLGLSLGYKLNDKSIVGIGASYKMGLGSIQHLAISHQGIGVRSFVDWKLKKQFFVTGGFELNYNAQFRNIEQLKSYNDWQKAGLIGLTKKIQIQTKWAKGSKMQLLYDVLHKQHIPASQPVVFRIGYDLNKK